MRKTEEIIEEVAKKENLSEEHKKMLQEMVTDLFEKGLTPAEALGFTEKSTEALYGQAYRFYQAAHYKEAGYIFTILQTINPKDPRFYFGMGACLHRLGEYLTASFMYELSGELDPINPMPLYYSSDCRIKLGHFDMAYDLLLRVVKRCGNKEPFQAVKDRAKMTLDAIEGKAKENAKELEESNKEYVEAMQKKLDQAREEEKEKKAKKVKKKATKRKSTS